MTAKSSVWNHLDLRLCVHLKARHGQRQMVLNPVPKLLISDFPTNINLSSSHQVLQLHLSSKPGTQRMYPKPHVFSCHNVFFQRGSQQTIPQRQPQFWDCSFVTTYLKIVAWTKFAPANSKNKSSTGVAAGTCLSNESKYARLFGACA